MEKYVYPAVAEKCEGIDNLCVYFPDFSGCGTIGNDLEEAKIHAVEALHLHLGSMLRDGDEIPQPTPIEKLEIAENEIPFLVTVEFENLDEAQVILSLPQNLLTLASDSGVNLNEVLIEGLKSRLQLQAN